MAIKKKRTQRKIKNNNHFVDAVLNIFLAAPFTSYNYKQISHALGISDNASRQLVKNLINDLLKSNILVEGKPGKYTLHPEYIKEQAHKNLITGTVDMKQTGKAYIISDELDEDIFIAANNTNRSLNGDLVKVQLFPKRKGRKTEGRITEIIKRKKTQFVGTLEIVKDYGFVVPDNTSIPVDIFIPTEKRKNGKSGQKVIAKITDWPKHANNPFGEITTVLGKPGNNNVEMNAILAEVEFPLRFPDKVLQEASKISDKIGTLEIQKRRDFRKIFTCTIDPQDAKDFDDALSLKKLPNGNWEVGIHIADVSHYVKENTAMDREAYERGTSIYLADRVIPMLPEKLSNNVCSLKPNEDKLCYSVVFTMNENAEIENQWFGKSIIHSDRRFNYDEVQEIIEKGKGDYSSEILILNKLALLLREDRYKKGSISFKSKEVRFMLDEQSKPVDIYIREQKESNMLVEDFMLLANRSVAAFIGKTKGRQTPKTFIYRIHDNPNPDKLEVFAEFVKKLGYNINISTRKATINSMNNLFREVEGKGEENLIETIAIRTMSKAVYSTENIGHYGLAFRYYTHFTSPIRRYPDLMVHRMLDHYLNGGESLNAHEFENKCKHSSDMEKRALEAERASIKYKQAEFMMDKIGQEFDGLISGVSKWGIFVELKETKCEGMISLKNLDDDFYYLDEDNYRVAGHNYGKEYKLGDEVKIVVKKVDINKKQMDFKLLTSSMGHPRFFSSNFC